MQWARLRFSPRRKYSVEVTPLEIKKVCWIITNSRAMATSSAKIAPTKHSAYLERDKIFQNDFWKNRILLTLLQWTLQYNRQAAKCLYRKSWILGRGDKLTWVQDLRTKRERRSSRHIRRRNTCDWTFRCSSSGTDCGDHDPRRSLCRCCNEMFGPVYTFDSLGMSCDRQLPTRLTQLLSHPPKVSLDLVPPAWQFQYGRVDSATTFGASTI